MIVIYASSEVLSKLGAVVIDSFSGWGAGEYEILFNLGAKFKVLDVGTIEVSGAASYKLQYRKAGASKWKTVKLSKTSIVLKKMKNASVITIKGGNRYIGIRSKIKKVRVK